MRTQAGAMRHVVDIMRISDNTDDTGGLIGQPKCIRRAVPCSIRALTGREAEQVHSVWSSATQIVELYADPQKQVTNKDYLTGGSLGKRYLADGTTIDRQLQINDVQDADEKKLILTLICEEIK